MHELAVWLYDSRIGLLSLANGRLRFQYEAAWLTQAHAIPLSCSLPLQDQPFTANQTRPFFAGLLPEGKQRRLIARQLHVHEQNDFALIEALGGECAGAVSLLPSDQVPQQGLEDIEWLSDEKLTAILAELPQHPMLAGTEDIRLSLAGAQEKLPVILNDQRIGLPKNGTPSTHILKPAIEGIPDSVVNESFCLNLAHALKLESARTQIRAVGTRSFLLVERYDRQTNVQAHTERLHQEDFCQALGYVPEKKYQNEQGPGFQHCFDLLRHKTRPYAPNVLRLLDIVIFNALIGNHDAHGKNFSLLYRGTGPVLAPFYDLLCTAVYPHLSAKMAMKLGGEYQFQALQRKDWERFAKEAGLTPAFTRQRILEIAQTLPLVARQLQATEPSFTEHPLVEKIVNLIEQRSTLAIKQLTLS